MVNILDIKDYMVIQKTRNCFLIDNAKEFVINKHKYMTLFSYRQVIISLLQNLLNLSNYSLKPIMAFIKKQFQRELL